MIIDTIGTAWPHALPEFIRHPQGALFQHHPHDAVTPVPHGFVWHGAFVAPSTMQVVERATA
jgi:hypothetical protein